MSDSNCTNPTLQSSLNRAARDKFVMVLELPHVLRKRSTEDGLIKISPLQMSVYGTVVPTIAVPSVNLGYAGQHLNLTSYVRPNYEPLAINFVVDNTYHNYYVLWKWLEVLNHPTKNSYSGTAANEITTDEKTRLGNNKEYQTTFSILALNEYNDVVLEFKYYNAFIVNLGGINYSYREGEILECTAQFQYNQLEVVRPTTQTAFL
jgi:hypothetical protein